RAVAIRFAGDHVGCRHPARPAGLALDITLALEFQPGLGDADAVAHRLVVLHDEIEEASIGVDDDRAGRIGGAIIDDLADIARIHFRYIDSRNNLLSVLHLAVHGLQRRIDRRWRWLRRRARR